MNVSLLPFTLQPQGSVGQLCSSASNRKPHCVAFFVRKLGRGRGKGIICIYNNNFQDNLNLKQDSPTLISPTHLCYKLSQDLGTLLGSQIPMDKEKNNYSQNVEVGHTGWMGWGQSQNKEDKPNGHLSSLGTKMF